MIISVLALAVCVLVGVAAIAIAVELRKRERISVIAIAIELRTVAGAITPAASVAAASIDTKHEQPEAPVQTASEVTSPGADTSSSSHRPKRKRQSKRRHEQSSLDVPPRAVETIEPVLPEQLPVYTTDELSVPLSDTAIFEAVEPARSPLQRSIMTRLRSIVSRLTMLPKAMFRFPATTPASDIVDDVFEDQTGLDQSSIIAASADISTGLAPLEEEENEQGATVAPPTSSPGASQQETPVEPDIVAHALAHPTDDSIAQLIGAYRNDPKLGERIAARVEEIGPESESLIPLAIALLSGTETEKQVAASILFAHEMDDEAASILGDSPQSDLLVAAHALMRYGTAGAREFLVGHGLSETQADNTLAQAAQLHIDDVGSNS